MSLCRRPIRRIALAAKTGSFINKTTLRSISQQNICTQIEQTYFTTQQPQLIGEEQQDNAIYKVYLKRLRYKSSSAALGSSSTLNTLGDDNNEQKSTGDDPNHQDGTLLYSTIKVYQLKAGTLDKIVECLTNDNGALDTTHMHILFSTYRTYTDTQTLIETLINRYQIVLPASLDMTEDVRQKTIKSLRTAITCLLNVYKEDFDDPPQYSTLTYLITHIPDKDLQKYGQKLLEEFEKKEENLSSNTDNNNNHHHHSKDGSVYNQKGFDYITPWNILDMSSTTIAEQLTIVDADLLKRVLPHECLTLSTNSSSRRSPSTNCPRSLSTVDKTIEYFNAVVARVVATILKEQDERTRCSVIEKWIDVAHQCRKLKNFSSLTAILNGLLSGCIYRLNTAWSCVNENYQSILEELKNVFGSCADRKQAREILDKQLDEVRLAFPECTEGTAKYADVTRAINVTLQKKVRNKMARDPQQTMMIGTVPYLGLYLSDLTYIDSAYPNTITIENSSEKLINFEKHRKEFEIFAQIKLFQSAANAYTTLHSLPRFKAWFDSVRIYNDAESWELSYEIEPKESSDSCQYKDQPSRIYACQRLRVPIQQFPSQLSFESLVPLKNGSTRSTNLTTDSLPSSPSLTSLDKISTTSNNVGFYRNQFSHPLASPTKVPYPTHSRSSSASSYLTSSNGSSSQGYASAAASPTISTGNCLLNSDENETIIAKVQLAGKDELLYKKVRIRNDERTTSVLKNILEKFCLNPATFDRYCIEQRLPDRKILILDHCNVFYALARSSDDEQIELIVREKTRQEREQKSNCPLANSGHNRTPSGLSIASAQSR